MVKKFFILIIILAFALFLPMISASCTVTLDKTSYVAGETATAAMSCSTNPEKNTEYTLNWTYQNGTSVELDTGTTPNTVNQLFYQSYIIPLSWPNGIYLNASMNGTGLTITQNDSANVTALGEGGSATLEIVNTTFGGGYLGLVSSVKATVTEENGKKISGGLCEVSALSNDETKILLNIVTTPINGLIEVSDILPPTRFDEGTDYAYDINCYCGSVGSSTECIDEDGNGINNSIGSARNFFTTKNWLNVNTVTDEISYGLKDEIFVCANVTNVDYPERIPLHIYYQVRCSKGTNSNSDTDRIIINRNEEISPDARGISSNSTQMQCMKFVIPEEKYLMGSKSECYASTNVWILDNSKTELLGYATTSPVFNISSDEINLEADWQLISENKINSIVNISNFNDLSGSGTGNVDIILNFNQVFNIQSIFEIANRLSNISISNSTSDLIEHTDYEIEFLEDGYVELEIRDVDLSSGWWNISFDFYNLDLRQTEALEGIENKTGTFHLAVECPSYAAPGNDINCQISAQVEDSQIVEKEVDFTCYLYDGSTNYNSLNFNQMINHTLFSVNKTISVPSTFTGTQNYIFQCEAGYYNLGSRIDYFYDSFITYVVSDSAGDSSGSSRGITGGAIFEPGEEEKEPETETTEDEGPLGIDKESYNKILFSLAILAGLIFLILIISRLKNLFSEKKNLIFKKTFYLIFATFIIVALIGAIYYSANFLKSINISEATALSDPLIRGIFLAFSIVMIIVILFKALNIRGEIKFGRDKIFDRYDKKIKEQEKLNKEILKKELQHMKNYKFVKVKK